MGKDEKNGAPETASSKMKAIKKHLRALKDAKETCEQITALKTAGVPKIIDAEIEKAKGYARKLIEQQLAEL